MSITHKRQLAELVRILDERGYVFAADPAPITEALGQTADSNENKLLRRAELMDGNGWLADALNRSRLGIFWLWVVAASVLFTISFSSTFMLMDSKGVNFFLVLASVLGMNTLMLLLWLVFLAVRMPAGRLVSNPATWFRGKDSVNQAVFRLYRDEWSKPSTRWRIGATAHSLWLSTLFGMLICLLLLLLVRQYTFNWESTLLSNAASVRAVEALAWLPEKFGFSVPDADAVLKSRQHSDIADARAWSGLLIGSIICYGILPRSLAWLVCKAALFFSRQPLPMDKPYYQEILHRWQQPGIVDADDRSEAVTAVRPKINLSNAPKWAVLLEAPWQGEAWYGHVLGQEWLDKGVADHRDVVAELEAELLRQPAQLLIGIRAHAVPDRGVLRQISRLAEAAQGGAMVQLLLEEGREDCLQQWRDALTEREIAWLNPPPRKPSA
ncbi:MAG: DUF2868 domain-containing protein [Neisseria sp.]|nr:DUF2868 domain-containing protein [Neisseria sp.]